MLNPSDIPSMFGRHTVSFTLVAVLGLYFLYMAMGVTSGHSALWSQPRLDPTPVSPSLLTAMQQALSERRMDVVRFLLRQVTPEGMSSTGVAHNVSISVPVLPPDHHKRNWSHPAMKQGSLAQPGFRFDGVCGESGYKCVVSYGLYGGNPKYTEGAIQNAQIISEIYPGWVMRVYHDASVPSDILRRLREMKVELTSVGSEVQGGDIAGMFWRFLIAEDTSVDRYLVRDSDSRLNVREKHAVEEWMESGYSIHSLRDHPNHDRPLNGGMWGGVKGAVKNIRSMVSLHSRHGYGADLDFLNHKVWPSVKEDQLSHDSYSCTKYVNAHPFPTRRPDNLQHCGQVYENNLPRMSDITCCLIGNHNPPACRGKPNWEYG